MEYATKGTGTAALATGIIGTTLGLLDGIGGMAGLLGGGKSEGDRPVTRYEMGLIKESMGKDQEITLLKSQQYTDHAVMGIQGQISAQNAWNAAQAVNIQNIQNQLAQVIKPFVPNYALAPGYGPALVAPAPVPLPPFPTAPPAASGTTSTSGTSGSGN